MPLLRLDEIEFAIGYCSDSLLGMSTELKELEDRAMKLSERERERLASHLFRSLDDEVNDTEWESEIIARIAQIEAGSAASRSIDDVFAEADQRTA